MDHTSATIVDYALALSYDALPAQAVVETRRRLLDALGCAFGGFDSPPGVIVRRLARTVSGTPSARVFGEGTATTPELAALCNGIFTRYLDYNDTLVSTTSLHLSDVIPALLAVAEANHATGRDLLLSIVLAYDVGRALCQAVNIRERGWDQGTILVLASAAGCGKLLGLDRTQLAHALALAIVPNIALRQTRAGELSMWKGAASAAAAQAGVFAARLASLGMTGPGEPFEGKDGLWHRVTGEFHVDLPGAPARHAVEEANIKLHPAEYHSQAFLDLVPTILSRAPFEAIDTIEIETYWLCYSEIGSEPAKWRPETRETADHSLPYILARALRDGRIGLDSFAEAVIHDPVIHDFMPRIHIEHNQSFTDRYPTELLSQVIVTTRAGEHVTLECQLPRGHFRNPASDADLRAKFDSLAEHAAVSTERAQAVLNAVATLDQAAGTRDLVDSLLWLAEPSVPASGARSRQTVS
jgi:2-methylcitrate dehydratase